MTFDPLELEELEGMFKLFKNKKSSVNYCMNIDLLKHASVEVKIRYIKHNICWSMHKIPDEWTRGVICPIFEKENRHDCNNYRGISLLNVAYKVYAKIMIRRLKTINEHVLSDEQYGFCKGRSYSGFIFIM
jgi:sorting nexin-29